MQQYIGIDVGGTHVKYGVINSDGEELTHHQFDTPEDASTFTRKWQDVVARCQQDYDIAAIGVSFPGHINPHNGHAAKAGALAYLDDVNLMELFSGLTDLPLVVENDANCAALGEMWRGAGSIMKTWSVSPLEPALAAVLSSDENCIAAHISMPVNSASCRSGIMAKVCIRSRQPAD
ncbi:sugar kinase [Salmonella enterica subsp. enterica]|uniref:Sugar kinase n=1 Tax=Salmonella enterica I TaxID=59201 RepID=A0A379WL32_SALET|nr:sugar kinase [Salmonella enterica subsp. enterica]